MMENLKMTLMCLKDPKHRRTLKGVILKPFYISSVILQFPLFFMTSIKSHLIR